MFGIGGIEFLLIAIVAVLVIGPNELPRVLYNMGKAVSKFREFTRSISDGFDQISREGELDDIISKANEAGDTHTAFRMEQQKALEERTKNGEASVADIDDEEFDEAEADISAEIRGRDDSEK